ncbi:hypothetical protein [Halpernia sp.]|uniref:hypothetical protein n=1 Tax=Halpernia sp. TaxID=2782209 RepID=UPI003A8F446B
MKKIFLLFLNIGCFTIFNAQIFTPNGNVNTVTNGTNYVGVNAQPIATFDVQNKFLVDKDLPIAGTSLLAYSAPWTRGYYFSSPDALTNFGGFGAHGPANDLDFFFIGNYSTPIVKFNAVDKSAIFNGSVGIGNNLPTERLDVSGNIVLRNITNIGGAGSSIYFTSFASDSPGARIKSSLEFASGVNSKSSLILSSYYSKYMNELTLKNGMVGIGTDNPEYNLDVKGKAAFSDNVKIAAKLEAKEIKVTTTPTADFVFEEDYQLPTLEEVEKHIKEKKHLPEIASAKEMEKEGVNVGEFQIKLLQKIEELTLYSIEQNKQIKELQEENKTLRLQSEKIEALEQKLQQLLSK